MRLRICVFASLTLLSISSLLTGCSSKFDPMEGTTPPETPLGTMKGIVHGGHQADVGAAVYVYQAGTGGYGTASKSLLTSTPPMGDSPTYADGSGNYYVKTDVNGSFNITGDYTCTSGAQVYLYVLGGNTGGGSANPNAGFLAVLGQCPASGTLSATISNVYVNEVSTVAAAYALAGYATDATHIAGPATTDTLAQTGLANAFATAGNLYNIGSSGSSPGALATTPGGNGTVPQAKINSLANSLAACVNTTGSSTTAPNACNTLLGDALSGGTTGTTPTDTATAAINIAHNPAANVSGIFGLATGTAIAYAPFLNTAPSDWSVTISYTSPDFSTITGLAMDNSDNLWVLDSGGNGATTEVSNLGVIESNESDSYAKGAYGLAWDTFGNLWFNAAADGYLLYYVPPSTSLNGWSVKSNKTQIAIDGNGYAYSPEFTSTTKNYVVVADAASGSANTWTLTNYVVEGYAVAIDSNNVAWMPSDNTASTSGATLFEFQTTAPGTSSTDSVAATCTGTNFDQGSGVAIDSSNNVWVSDGYTGYIIEFNNANPCTYKNSFHPVSSGGLNGIAIDGGGNVFAVTTNAGGLVELNNSGTFLSETGGYATGVTGTLSLPVIDASGNVWFVSSGNTINEVVGIGLPVTPLLATAVASKTIATKP
jgi:hypothetical protein